MAIGELIREATAFALAGSKVRSQFSIPENLWPARIDPGQIGQVIQNLVINADHAMPNGGVLDVRAENVAKQGARPLAEA